MREKNVNGVKIEDCGLCLLNFSIGLDRVMNRNEAAIVMAENVAWVSPSFTPSIYNALRVYADIRQLSARIWYI
eukprot:TRINITY_DN2721_c0_g1_i1.p2 TRINITY_DN2721_c0_g1~~TRINITY_DN2721_c0_g1_i1.p2  ORF type:complete len:74 (+),score=6.89 TRINITY_DN2721_c0_g1_i1:586-807(+)